MQEKIVGVCTHKGDFFMRQYLYVLSFKMVENRCRLAFCVPQCTTAPDTATNILPAKLW